MKPSHKKAPSTQQRQGDTTPRSGGVGVAVLVAAALIVSLAVALDSDLQQLLLSIVRGRSLAAAVGPPAPAVLPNEQRPTTSPSIPADKSTTPQKSFQCGSVLQFTPRTRRDPSGDGTWSVVASAAKGAAVPSHRSDEQRGTEGVGSGGGDTADGLRLPGATIPFAWVNDNYCDCSDGSDEPATNACASGSRKAEKEFACRSNPARKVSAAYVNDGVYDCPDGSDEVGYSGPKKVAQGAWSESAVAARRAEALRRVGVIRAGHEVFQQRASFGSTTWGTQFARNVSEESKLFQEHNGPFQEALRDIQTRIRTYGVRGSGPPLKGADAELQVDPQEVQEFTALNQKMQRKHQELAAKQQLIQQRALGPYYEYFPLLGNCYNITLHEKALRGGKAEPEQFYVLFHVCPFSYILQRTLTPDVVAAEGRHLARESRARQRAAHGDGGGAAPGSADEEDPRERISAYEDQQLLRYILCGHWTGVLPDAYDNITALDVTQTLRSERAASLPPLLVSQYEYGESCSGEHGPRVAALVFTCDSVDRVLKLYENGNCRYEVLFGTPSACSDAEVQAEMDRLKQQRLL